MVIGVIETVILAGALGIIGIALLGTVSQIVLAKFAQDSSIEQQKRVAENNALALQAVTGVNGLNATDKALQSSVQDANQPSVGGQSVTVTDGPGESNGGVDND